MSTATIARPEAPVAAVPSTRRVYETGRAACRMACDLCLGEIVTTAPIVFAAAVVSGDEAELYHLACWRAAYFGVTP